MNYERDYSHSHCFESDNPPCGIKGKHRCCLCEKSCPTTEKREGWEEEFVEEAAAIEHERWAKWQSWMHGICKLNSDGSITIYPDLVERWERQIKTPYSELSEREKESDRIESRKYLPLIQSLLSQSFQEGRETERRELREKLEDRQKLLDFIPQDKYGYKNVKSSDLDILSLLANKQHHGR